LLSFFFKSKKHLRPHPQSFPLCNLLYSLSLNFFLRIISVKCHHKTRAREKSCFSGKAVQS
jgi:hypothetical protein